MSRTVVAMFPDAQAARRAAVALGRAELAAGPTRVQVDAAGPERGARLELRVEAPDEPRAIALMREHGAAVSVPARGTGRDLRSGSDPLAAWGMTVADAVTAAMDGASSPGLADPGSSAAPEAAAPSSPSTGDAGDRLGAAVPAPIWGNAPSHGQAGTASGTRTRAAPATPARADDVPIDDPRPPGQRPRSET